MTDEIAEIEDDEDDYDRLLAAIGRTEEHDQRVAIHECGHVLVNRIIGNSSISSVTITPADGFDGICVGARREAFVSSGVTDIDAIDASDIRKILQPLMPKAGEDRSEKADVYQSVLDAVTELMAGKVAEKNVAGRRGVIRGG